MNLKIYMYFRVMIFSNDRFTKKLWNKKIQQILMFIVSIVFNHHLNPLENVVCDMIMCYHYK